MNWPQEKRGSSSFVGFTKRGETVEQSQSDSSLQQSQPDSGLQQSQPDSSFGVNLSTKELLDCGVVKGKLSPAGLQDIPEW